MRETVVWALGQLEDPASLKVLVAALGDQSTEVRRRAAWAIGTLGPDQAPPELIAALRNGGDADLRLKAAWALGQIADTVAVPSLVAAMHAREEGVRQAAFWALSQMDGETVRVALLPALQDPDPEIRAKAARALGGGGANPWPWPWPWPR